MFYLISNIFIEIKDVAFRFTSDKIEYSQIFQSGNSTKARPDPFQIFKTLDIDGNGNIKDYSGITVPFVSSR